jgi:hypothetical protein
MAWFCMQLGASLIISNIVESSPEQLCMDRTASDHALVAFD